MEAATDLVRRLTNDVFVGGNLDAFDDIVSADFVSHDPPPGLPATRDGLRAIAETVTSKFSNQVMVFNEVIETTDGRVVENWLMSATHTGEAFGIPASGRVVRIRGMEIWRCEGGKVVEHWGAIDMSDLFAPGS